MWAMRPECARRAGWGSYRVRFYEPSLSVFLNSWQVLFLTTYPQRYSPLVIEAAFGLDELDCS